MNIFLKLGLQTALTYVIASKAPLPPFLIVYIYGFACYIGLSLPMDLGRFICYLLNVET